MLFLGRLVICGLGTFLVIGLQEGIHSFSATAYLQDNQIRIILKIYTKNYAFCKVTSVFVVNVITHGKIWAQQVLCGHEIIR